jgi:hypothetical protein
MLSISFKGKIRLNFLDTLVLEIALKPPGIYINLEIIHKKQFKDYSTVWKYFKPLNHLLKHIFGG